MTDQEKARVENVLNNVAQMQIDLEDLHLNMNIQKKSNAALTNTVINLNKRIEKMENGNGSNPSG